MKKATYLFAITTLLFAACDSKKQADEGEQKDTTSVAMEPAQNTLTEQQKAEGWKLLFNGQNLDGWKFYKGADGTRNWNVVDGTLHTKSDSVSSADIMTVDKYENFDLTFDFKVSPRANSGVMYRVT